PSATPAPATTPPAGQPQPQQPAALPYVPPSPPPVQAMPTFPPQAWPTVPPQASPPVWPQVPTTPPVPTATPPPAQPGPPAEPDGDGSAGYDITRLPKGAREEIERLRQQVAQRERDLRIATVSQQAQDLAVRVGIHPQA